MIVNPQLFNYRLIIGTLVIAIVVLGSYSFSSYNTIKSQDQFMTQEVRLVHNELSDAIALYEKTRVANHELLIQLQQSKSKMEAVLDSLNMVKADSPLITKYKNDIAALLTERKHLFSRITTLLDENSQLQEQEFTTSEALSATQQELKKLTQHNLELAAIIKNITALTANNIVVKALITRNSQLDIQTFKARETDNMEICFTVLKNDFSPEGNKDIYVQIIGPDNNVVSNRGVATFGEASLIYSGKTTVNYKNANLNVCTKINIEQKKALKKGDYLVSVFHDDTKLGTSKITLN